MSRAEYEATTGKTNRVVGVARRSFRTRCLIFSLKSLCCDNKFLYLMLLWILLDCLYCKFVYTVLCINVGERVRYESENESEVAQSCPTLCDPMDCSLPGSSVHGIFQARVLEWGAISFSRGSSQPRDWTQVSCIPDRLLSAPLRHGLREKAVSWIWTEMTQNRNKILH